MSSYGNFKENSVLPQNCQWAKDIVFCIFLKDCVISSFLKLSKMKDHFVIYVSPPQPIIHQNCVCQVMDQNALG